MTEKIKLLIELQELGITLNETEILHGDKHQTEQVRERQRVLRDKIDVDSLARYDRLANHGLAVVGITGSMCLGCHMSIPAGDMNRMLKKESAPCCPNCGRFLNLEDA